ncbi:MAG: hypothetical protein ABI231_06285 [Candidatus Tumulicola sp.]
MPNPFDPGDPKFQYLVSMMSAGNRPDSQSGCGCGCGFLVFVALGLLVVLGLLVAGAR